MQKNAFLLATCLALSTAFISGVSNFVNKIAVTGMQDPIAFTTLKNGLVALLLLALLVAARKWREIGTLTKRQIWQLLLIGIVGGGISFTLFFLGLAQTSAINAALIHKTLFVWVIVFAVPFLGERLRTWQVVGVAAIFLANILVGGFGGFQYNSGELMILAATVLWAVENVLAKIALRDLSAELVAASRITIGVLVLLPLALSRGGKFELLTGMSQQQWLWTGLAAALLFGYVVTWYAALKRAPAVFVATLLVPATLVTNVLSAVFISHSFNWQLTASAGLFIVGTALVVVFVPVRNEPAHAVKTASQIG